MKRATKLSWLLIVLGLLGLSACGAGGLIATPTVDSALIFTQIASTALALQTQTVLAMPTATSTPQVAPTAQTTPLFTATSLPGLGPATATPLALTTPLASSQTGCDNMKYIADVTIPDGYVAAHGEVLKKTWTVENLGPCTWNMNYVLIFGWGGQGTDWSTAQPVRLSKPVVPYQNIDISVPLKTPSTPGEYVATFKLQNDKGFNFPAGQQLTIDIVVK
jgi:Ig-like domain from next to BRCA1 gene